MLEYLKIRAKDVAGVKKIVQSTNCLSGNMPHQSVRISRQLVVT